MKTKHTTHASGALALCLSLLAVLLICWPLGARGEIAYGDYPISFGTNITLWDFSGSYTDSVADVEIQYSLNLDPAGKLTGAGTGTYDDLFDHLDFSVSMRGTVKSAGNVVRVNATVSLTGSGTVQGMAVSVSASVKERLELDPVGRQLVGTARGKVTVTVPGYGKASEPIPVTEVQTPLPDGTTGEWNLTLNVSTNRPKYKGTSALTLSNGRTIPLPTAGSYVAKSDTSKFTLRGTGLDRAISLALSGSITNGEMTVRRFKGKALGQTLLLPVSR